MINFYSYFIRVKKYASSDNSKFDKPTDHEKIFEQKITELNKEIFFDGIITKFNIDDLLEDIKHSGILNDSQWKK